MLDLQKHSSECGGFLLSNSSCQEIFPGYPVESDKCWKKWSLKLGYATMDTRGATKDRDVQC